MKIKRPFMLFQLAALFVFAGCPSPQSQRPGPSGQPVGMDLLAPGQPFPANAPVVLDVEYNNHSSAPVRILDIRVLEGYPLYFDLIDSNGKRVPFLGPELSPKVNDSHYVALKPGQTLRQQYDLMSNGIGGKGYALAQPGTYEVTAIYEGHYGLAEIRSAPVKIVIK